MNHHHHHEDDDDDQEEEDVEEEEEDEEPQAIISQLSHFSLDITACNISSKLNALFPVLSSSSTTTSTSTTTTTTTSTTTTTTTTSTSKSTSTNRQDLLLLDTTTDTESQLNDPLLLIPFTPNAVLIHTTSTATPIPITCPTAFSKAATYRLVIEIVSNTLFSYPHQGFLPRACLSTIVLNKNYYFYTPTIDHHQSIHTNPQEDNSVVADPCLDQRLCVIQIDCWQLHLTGTGTVETTMPLHKKPKKKGKKSSTSAGKQSPIPTRDIPPPPPIPPPSQISSTRKSPPPTPSPPPTNQTHNNIPRARFQATYEGTSHISCGILHLYREHSTTTTTTTTTSNPDVLHTESGNLLAILGVPMYLSASDLITWLGPFAEHISHLRLVKDHLPARYLVLLRFRLNVHAKSFFSERNGRAFSAFEPQLAVVVKITSLTFTATSIPPFAFPHDVFDIDPAATLATSKLPPTVPHTKPQSSSTTTDPTPILSKTPSSLISHSTSLLNNEKSGSLPTITSPPQTTIMAGSYKTIESEQQPLPESSLYSTGNSNVNSSLSTTTSSSSTTSNPSANHNKSATSKITVVDLHELPTCPVCLERMDANVSGIMTILCQHSYHCKCLRQWDGNACPVCRYTGTETTMTEPAMTYHCQVCPNMSDVWACLICGQMGCGRYADGHAQDHYQASGHPYALELSTQRVWDYTRDSYVHRLIQASSSSNSNGSSTNGGGFSKLVEVSGSSRMTTVPVPINGSSTTGTSSTTTTTRTGLRGESEYVLVSESDIARINKEYVWLLQSQVDAYQQVLEGHVSRLMEWASQAKDQVHVAKEQVKQMEQALAMKEKEVQEEKAISDALVVRNTELKASVAEKDVVVHELQEQVRDLMVYLDVQQMAGGGGGSEVQGGDVVGIGNSSKSKGKKKGKK